MSPTQLPFFVIELEQHNFLHFILLFRSFYVTYKVNGDGNAVVWQEMYQCSISQTSRAKYCTGILAHQRKDLRQWI
jgi:hypothetical protein